MSVGQTRIDANDNRRIIFGRLHKKISDAGVEKLGVRGFIEALDRLIVEAILVIFS